MQLIQSDILQAEINPIGAELSSLFSKKTGTEYLWQGSPEWWMGRAPILFPVVGPMKENAYNYSGTKYNMPMHGFIRRSTLNTATVTGHRVVFEHVSNDETRAVYPFEFIFQAIFELVDNSLATTYSVKNLNDCTMYFSVGAHEAFRCPLNDDENFDDYYLEFDKDGTYVSEIVDNTGIISGNSRRIIELGRHLQLRHSLFKKDAPLIFKNVPSSKVSLKSKKTTTAIVVDYKDCPHLGIWTRDGAPYICIEPWCGLPDDINHNGDITTKYGIISLEQGSEFAWTHTITINE